MNLSDSKKKLALAGVLCGLVAACLAYFGNPANMAFCMPALSVIRQELWDFTRPKLCSMQDRRSSVL